MIGSFIFFRWSRFHSPAPETAFSQFRVDKVGLRLASSEKQKRAPAVPIESESDLISEPLLEKREDILNPKNLFLIQLTKQLKKLNENCEVIAEDIFTDNNYIDPQFELYKKPGAIILKIDRVFREMLLQNKSKQAFEILKEGIENASSEGIAPNIWGEALRYIDVCRENEVFYFFETLFESFRYNNLKSVDRIVVIKHFLANVQTLLSQQQTMSNLLFVTNLVIKSTKALEVEEYIRSEAKRLFDDLIDYWRVNTHYYQENSEGKKKILENDFYKDYFRQTEYYHQELNRLLEEVLL